MITLRKTNPWYNHYFLDGKEINKILLFDPNGVVGTFKWFGSNNDFPELQIPAELKNKRKVDFNANYSFITKSEERYEKGFYLYVPISAIEHSEPTYIEEESLGRIATYKSFEIKLKAIKRLHRLDGKGGLEYYNDSEFKEYSLTVRNWHSSYQLTEKDKLKKVKSKLNDSGMTISLERLQTIKKEIDRVFHN